MIEELSRLRLSSALGLCCLAALAAIPAEALEIHAARTGPAEWTYDLVYAPGDNFALCGDAASITLRGLHGVVEALPPAATDYPVEALDRVNRAWRPEVLAGGTAVRWTNEGGSGNFPERRRIFGLRVVAPGAVNGRVDAVSDGFARDGQGCPAPDLDVEVELLGPVAAIADDGPANRPPIRLKTREWVPGAEPAAGLEARLNEVLAAKVSRGERARAHLVVTTTDDLTVERRDELAARGVELLQPLGGTAWIAAVDGDGLARLRDLEAIGWAGELSPADKVSPHVRPLEPLPHQLREPSGIAYTVLFHPGTGYSEAAAAVQRIGGRLEAAEEDFAVFQRGEAVIPQEALARLAAEDVVAWIEPPHGRLVPDNQQSQRLSRVDGVQRGPYNLTGAGIGVGLWEAIEGPGDGAVLFLGHDEYEDRVSHAGGQATAVTMHATHVAGTIAGDGSHNPRAEGMAPGAEVVSYDAANDAVEMARAARTRRGGADPLPIRVSNHSYGEEIGWARDGASFTFNQLRFGDYDALSQGFDQVVTQTGLVVVKSAGNDRDDDRDPGVPWTRGGDPPADDCAQAGGVDADCISPRGVAKNVITVGSVAGGDEIADYSNFGPTDDGRLKPDLVADGEHLLSTAANDFDRDGIDDCRPADRCHFSSSGTSMATPVVAGAAALLLEQLDALGIAAAPSTVRAVLYHTARDFTAGEARVGPDFATGWGIVDAQAAADLVRDSCGPGVLEAVLDQVGRENRSEFLLPVRAGSEELRVTLAWDDPAAAPAARRSLVNNLDLELISPVGHIVRPWGLDPQRPRGPFRRDGGFDWVNNAEQVLVLHPEVGVWTVRVSAPRGNLPQGPQRFSVAGVRELTSLGGACTQDCECTPERGGRGYCADGARCAPPDGFGQVGDYCHHNNHCGSGLSCDCSGAKNGPWCDDWEGGNRGTCQAPKGLGSFCGENRDCAPVRGGRGYCADGRRCAPPDGFGRVGDYCHHDNHCGAELLCPMVNVTSGYCIAGHTLGNPCTRDLDCAPLRGTRGYCADGARCAPRDGTGQTGDYCHHDNHCGPGLSCLCGGPKNGPWCDNWEGGNAGNCG